MKRQRIIRFLLARSAETTRSASVVVTGVSGTLASTGSPKQVGAGVALAFTVPHLDRLSTRLERRAQRFSARAQQARDPRVRRPAGRGVRAGGRPIGRGVPIDRGLPVRAEPARARPSRPDRRSGQDRRSGPSGPDRRSGQDRRERTERPR